MKLSDFAKQINITYQTAWNWWNAGKLNAYQTETGTVIVDDDQPLKIILVDTRMEKK